MQRIRAMAVINSFNEHTGEMALTIAMKDRPITAAMTAWLQKTPADLGIGRLYRRRTTGKHSQCSHYHGHLWQLVNSPTSPCHGTDMDALDYAMRYRAISWGWKYRIIGGVKVPFAEPEGNTYEYGRLIDCTHHFADELGFVLNEGTPEDWERIFLGE